MKIFRLSKILKSKRGFTLVECVLSLLIFAFVAILFAIMFSTANLLTQRAQDMDNALDAVINKVETGTGAVTPSTIQQVNFVFKNEYGTDTSIPANIAINSYKDAADKITMKDFDAVP